MGLLSYNRYTMRGKLIFLTILFLLFLGAVGVKFFILDASNTTGQIKINATPAAMVFIDDQDLGRTPFEQKLEAGEHMVKLIPLGASSASASFSHRIRIEKNTLSYMNVELGASDVATASDILGVSRMTSKASDRSTGEIMVETDPPGGIVSLDNEEKGTASLVLASVARGNHEVSVYLPTFFPRTQKVHVEPGYRVQVFFKLAIDKNQDEKRKQLQKKVQGEATKKEDDKKIVVIGQTGTGWLRVREEGSLSGVEVGKVDSGREFEVQEEKSGWYKIEYEKGKMGWVSGEFATLKSNITPTPTPLEEDKSATRSAG